MSIEPAVRGSSLPCIAGSKPREVNMNSKLTQSTPLDRLLGTTQDAETFDANGALNRLLDAAKNESPRGAQNPTALSVESVTRDIERLKARRRELNERKRELARSVAQRDEAATKEFSSILAEQSALDLDEEVWSQALSALKEDQRREALRANAAQIDEHRRRAGELVSQVVGHAAELERAAAQLFESASKLGDAEQSLKDALRSGRVSSGQSFPSISGYALDRIFARVVGRHASSLNTPIDERAESTVGRYRDLPSVLDSVDV
jgi:hypothetical protein